MNASGAPPHYVRHNQVTRVPRNFVYLDAEANAATKGRVQTQTFRLAVARYDRRSHKGDGWCEPDELHTTSSEELWAWIDARCKPKARTVLVAHNLGYDLRLTDALRHLPALGWELTAIRLNAGNAWCAWKRDGRTLQCCDSLSWVPASLDKLGAMVGVPKLPLPSWEDDDDAWFARCRRDVEILSVVWRRLLEWVRGDDLGNWKPTGAGQAFAAYRHRFMGHRLLAHDNGDARTAERRAAWTGRCEVWQHGHPAGGPFTEWDYTAAYARVGASTDVPTVLVGESSNMSGEQWLKLRNRFAVLTEVDVDTESPTTPALIDDRIAWPVGKFTTTIWDNELALAAAHGASFVIRRVWWYKRAPALKGFMEWVLTQFGEQGSNVDPVIALAAKHWSRALVGRFGARWSEWETIGRGCDGDLFLARMIDGTTGERYDVLQVGDVLKRQSAVTDCRDSVVAIMSYVMAECRVRLWDAIEAAGAENVVYMDTDGLIVNASGDERLLARAPVGFRAKQRWSSVDLAAPRQIVLSGRLKASGVPSSAVKVGPNVYEAEVWAGLSESIRNGHPDAVAVSKRRIRLSGTDNRREHLADGTTKPRRVTA